MQPRERKEVDSVTRTLCFATLAAMLLAAAPALRADTPVGGVICTDTTWDLAGSPYVVTVAAGGSIVVGCDATLTVEAGVEVRFEPAQALLVGWSAWGPGTLVARGTEPSPILFTSDQPDPAPGDWSRIDFLDQAADATFDPNENYESGCILEHVIVEYAGSGDYAAVNVEYAAPFFSDSEVRENLKRGIGVYSAPPLRIETCYVHDNQDGGMYFSATPGNRLTGNTIEENTAGAGGAGIYFSYSGTNTLTDNTISGNSARWGGGTYFSSSPGNELTGNTISGNSAGDHGGGTYFSSSPGNELTGNTISGNSSESSGGGIYFKYSNSNTLTGNTISANSAYYYHGGGIYFHSSGSNELTGNTISGNNADYGRGGGTYFSSSPGNELTGNTISGNSAGDHGGGIYFSGSSSNTLTGNTISGNSSESSGGGISLFSSDGNTLTDNTIEDNTADGEGGAIYLDNSDNNGPFTGNTIRFNHTSAGLTGGIFVTNGSEWLLLNGGAEAYNTICCNDGYEVYNDNTFYGGDARNDIDARNVFWGTDDTGVIQAEIHDFFDDASWAMVLWYPYLWSPPAGDLNCDGLVNFFDIEPFVVAITDPASYYPEHKRYCIL